MAGMIGRTLGNYTLGDRIGKGGMADVYQARQESMDRDVAVKVMAESLAANEEFLARFEREARMIAKLQHPHILPVIDFGRDGDYIFLVMRLISGGSLAERIQDRPFTLVQIDKLLNQIASALHYAHQRGIIHRDLKPNNILLDDEDNAYLTDFGIAKMLAGTTGARSLTATGNVMGTPAYMAPEQWRSEAVDARTDIYALGVILFEMLMGALPFQAETPFAMMYKHFDTPPPQPRVINPEFPDQIEMILSRALAKAPTSRYPSAQVMSSDFGQVVRALPPALAHAELPRATPQDIERATPQKGVSAAGMGATTPGGLPGAAPLARDIPTEMVDTPASGSIFGPGMGTTTPAPPAVSARRGGGRMVAVVLGLVAVVVVVALIVMALNSGDKSSSESDAAQTGTALADLSGPIRATATATSIEEATDDPTDVPTATTEPSLTPDLDATADALAVGRLTATAESWTDTPEPTATEAPSATPEATATDVPTETPTETPTITPDYDATTNAMIAEWQTLTAIAWTATPTPDVEQTVLARFTLTAQAWTATPSNTPTTTPTRTPTFTMTPSITPSATPSLTPSNTPTATRTRQPTPVPTITPWPSVTPITCSMRARMRVDEGGRVMLEPPLNSRVRSAPGTRATTLREVPPGQTFEVIDGPECMNDINWWQVEGVDSRGSWFGWIAEGQNGVYWIERFDTGPIDCPGAPAPRMVPGEQGRITLYPALSSRVRSLPNTDGSIIGQLQPGEEFNVITGPVCDTENRWRWWGVENDRIAGWVAEGPVGEYWMEPLP